MNREELLKVAKPILFNAEMVWAILEGRKTVTRRIVRNGDRTPTGIGRDKFYKYIDTLNGKRFAGASFYKDSDIFYVDGARHIDAEYFKMRYKIGDILYVRETWIKTDCLGLQNGYLYKANDKQNAVVFDSTGITQRWKPSIHMPKEAARIFLKVTNVRCERLQDITVDECCREGCCSSDCYGIGKHSPDCKCDARFINTWNSTIKPADMPLYGWNANPWVWVYEFKKVEVEQ